MERITYDGMRNFIIENELTDSVAISLHPDSFDELVMDYLDINDNQIEGLLKYWVSKSFRILQQLFQKTRLIYLMW